MTIVRLSAEKLMTPFSLGLGGKVGDGSQYMSWISLQDAVRAIEFVIRTPELSGPVNMCAPNPVTNAQFTGTLLWENATQLQGT